MTKIQWRKLATSSLISTLLLNPVAIAAQTVHTVVEGDTVYNIAQKNGVTVEEIYAWNGLSGDAIQVGQALIVENPDDATHEENGDGPATPTPTPTPTPQTPADGSHVVGPGDTLSGIAAVYGVTVDQLYAWNGLTSSFLQVGDIIAVGPDGATHVSQGHEQPQAPAYPPVATSGRYLTVQTGDTLSGLAWAYGTTVEAFMAANGLSSDWLNAGQQLAVPADALYQDANQYTTPVAPAAPAPTASGTPNKTQNNAAASPRGGTEHIVQAGDTLSGIAVTYGVALDDLYAWNPSISDQLQIGQAVTLQIAGPVNNQQSMSVQDPNGVRRVLDLTRIPENVRPKTYVVKAGDNIWRIADAHKVSADSIRMWNELPAGDDSLRIGETIFVSNPAFVPDMHEVADGEDLEAIAKAAGVTVDNIVKWNELADNKAFKKGDILFVSNPRPLTHNVKPGETLEEIATNYKIELADLRKWNYLPENSRIINGTLIVSNPKEATPAATQAAPESTEASSETAESTSSESQN